MDKSLIIVVQKLSRIIALKGKHQVGTITSAERGQNITVICCISALFNFIPPGLIFPRACSKTELQDGDPPAESTFACQAS